MLHLLTNLSRIPDYFVFEAPRVSHMPQGDIHLLASLVARTVSDLEDYSFLCSSAPCEEFKAQSFTGYTLVQDAFCELEGGGGRDI